MSVETGTTEPDETPVYRLAEWKWITIGLLAAGQTIPVALVTGSAAHSAGVFTGWVLFLYLFALLVTVAFSRTGWWLDDSGVFEHVSTFMAGVSVLPAFIGLPAIAVYIPLTAITYAAIMAFVFVGGSVLAHSAES